MNNSLLRTATVLLLVTNSAWSQNAAPPTAAPPKARAGYLTPAEMPDVVRIVPPPPVPGSPRATADLAIFHATRSLEGSPRWALALSDDSLGLPGLFRAFSCSLGVTLSRENAPRVSDLITRANADAGRAASVLKDLYQVKRPYQVAEGNVCLTPQGRTALERVPDYVSGHTAASWEAGLVLAALAPDAATEVLLRARAFGESRVVCGVHSLSAVEGAWLSTTAVFAAQNGSAAFRADLAAAQAELAALRASAAAKPESCALEAATLSKSPY